MPLSLGSRLCVKNPDSPLPIAPYLSLTHLSGASAHYLSLLHLSGASACYLSLFIYLPLAVPCLSHFFCSLTHLSGASACYLSLLIYRSPGRPLPIALLPLAPSPIWGATPNPATYFHTHRPMRLTLLLLRICARKSFGHPRATL